MTAQTIAFLKSNRFALTGTAARITPQTMVDFIDTVVARTPSVRVTDPEFGAKGDGIADDTAAITAAVAATPVGGLLYFPPGNYLISSAITLSTRAHIHGAGRRSSTITNTSATAHSFMVSSADVVISDLGFSASVTRTAGSFVRFDGVSAGRSIIERFFMLNAFVGIELTSTFSVDLRIIDGSILNYAATGAGITVAAGLSILIDSVLIQQGAAPGATTAAGIVVTNCGDLALTNSQLISAGTALNVVVGAGQAVTSLWVSETYLDSSVYGCTMQATGGGFIARAKFVNSWACSMTQQGIRASTASGGSIGGVDFIGCHIMGNTSVGAVAFDGGCFDFRFMACAFAGNGGAAIQMDTDKPWSVIGCRIGNSYGFGNNNGAISIGAAAVGFIIKNNDLTGNTGNAIQGAGGAGGTLSIIADNLGWISRNAGLASIAAGSTTVTFAHGLSATFGVAPPASLVSLTPQSSLGSAKTIWVSATSTTQITVTCDVAPGGAGLSFAWQARMANSGV